MILRDAIDAYVAWQQAHGARFIASARLLHLFCQHVGGGIGCDAVEEPDVRKRTKEAVVLIGGPV